MPECEIIFGAGRKFRTLIQISLLTIVSGCASYPVNAPLDKIDPEAGYRLNNRILGEKNSDDVFIILGLSGGGARAEALDYGVIQFLDRVRFGPVWMRSKMDLSMTTARSSP